MIQYPNIPKYFLKIGNIEFRWYGLMYFLAFVISYLILKYLSKTKKFLSLKIDKSKLLDILFYGILGVIIGGRLGYILFYNLEYYINAPLKIFYIWEGGMSFHGGFIGVVIFEYLFALKNKLNILKFADYLILPVPIGLALGRLGNFINGELFGRVTNVPWCMNFSSIQSSASLCRHPSQIYEFFLEGMLLFFILWVFRNKLKKDGHVFILFIILYSVFRFFVEFFREPDINLGFVFLETYTMGQVLSFFMFIVGILLYLSTLKAKKSR